MTFLEEVPIAPGGSFSKFQNEKFSTSLALRESSNLGFLTDIGSP